MGPRVLLQAHLEHLCLEHLCTLLQMPGAFSRRFPCLPLLPSTIPRWSLQSPPLPSHAILRPLTLLAYGSFSLW